MTKKQALGYINYGQWVIFMKDVERICKAFHIPLEPSQLDIIGWYGAADAAIIHSIMVPNSPGSGVNSAELSEYVVKQLGIQPSTNPDKDKRALENAKAIAAKFNIPTDF